MPDVAFNADLLEFLDSSPTPFHAVQSMAQRLLADGFEHLEETEAWQLQPGKAYFTSRDGGAIIAFRLPQQQQTADPMRMVGAHTDSPCLKVKPNPTINKKGYNQVGVEVYGGALLYPWFDRDLSLAGRVSYKGNDGKLHQQLINFKRAIASIPSLAIHLNREVNKKLAVNPQVDLPPILGQAKDFDFNALLKQQLKNEHNIDAITILGHQLSFYDSQNAAFVGLDQEFLASARLDNLLSCYIGLQALINNDCNQGTLLVCNDHEEVGSASASGAQGPFLQSVLQRIYPDPETFTRAMRKSMMISADNAHGVHPNFADRHDQQHGPLLNSGPVIKLNANQRYASNDETSAVFTQLCQNNEVAVQNFVVRSDLACGSTIGPITATELGVKTIDIGVPTFAMHSIRETAGSQDAFALFKVLLDFYNLPQLFD